MPTYAFTARTATGKTTKGLRVKGSEQDLAQELAAEGQFLIRARTATPRDRGLHKVRLNAKDLSMFLLHIASYIEAGLSLLDALRDYRDPKRPKLEALVMDMSTRLTGGSSLSETMAAYPALFPPIHVSMIQAGETMGRLDEAIRAVIALVEWDEKFRSQFRSAATYPIILVCLLGLIGILVSVFSLPQIMKMLAEMNIPLPMVTRVFLACGSAMVKFWWVLIAVPLGTWLGMKFALRNPAFRLKWDTALLSMPLVGALITRTSLSRFSHFFGQQYRAGIPLVQALRESEDVTGNTRMGLCIQTIREGVEQGERLAIMAAQVGYFPNMIVRMLAIGEETGNLEETLEKTGKHFDDEGAAGVKLFFEALDPVLKIAVAGGVIFVAAAVLLPMYTLIGGINE